MLTAAPCPQRNQMLLLLTRLWRPLPIALRCPRPAHFGDEVVAAEARDVVLTQPLCLPRRPHSRGSCELCAPRPHMRAPTRAHAEPPTKEARSRRAAAFVNSGELSAAGRALVAEPFAPGTTTEQPAPPRAEQMRPADTNLNVPVADARRIGVVSMQLPRIAVRSQLAVDATVVSHSCTPAMPHSGAEPGHAVAAAVCRSDIRPILRCAQRAAAALLSSF